jgi:hypothetical protein
LGAKDWMLFYADNKIRPILQAAPRLDRGATEALIERLYPLHQIAQAGDGTLLEQASPAENYVYAGCFPGLAVVCTRDAALDRPSQLHQRFRDEAGNRTLYLHAMHSVVDWFAYAIWTNDRTLRRTLSLSPDMGIIENVGTPLNFERPFWAGARQVEAQRSSASPYPLPFHPLELGEEALRTLFGFNYEGLYRDNDPDLEDIVLAGFTVTPFPTRIS